MHYHCEVIFPPETDVVGSVASIMKQFDENMDDSEEYSTHHLFWDWYVIGGRFAGNKLLARYDREKLDEFSQWGRDEGIMVKGLVCGKEEIASREQREKVDNKWNEMFPHPGNVMVACPLFQHSNDQYAKDTSGTLEGDICTLGNVPKDMKCCRVIFGGPSWESETNDRTGPLEAVFMLSTDFWNGVNHIDTVWDGSISQALAMREKDLERRPGEYVEKMRPADDWIAVTVDYHS